MIRARERLNWIGEHWFNNSEAGWKSFYGQREPNLNSKKDFFWIKRPDGFFEVLGFSRRVKAPKKVKIRKNRVKIRGHIFQPKKGCLFWGNIRQFA